MNGDRLGRIDDRLFFNLSSGKRHAEQSFPNLVTDDRFLEKHTYTRDMEKAIYAYKGSLGEKTCHLSPVFLFAAHHGENAVTGSQNVLSPIGPNLSPEARSWA